VQPRFAGHVVTTAVYRFVQDVCIITAETTDFLIEPVVSVFAQLAVTPIPQLVPVRERALDALTRSFENVFADDLGIDRW
jgi:hypothetical protein